ncbi:MAG: SLC13 family permease, partial [Pseudomonadota bacterium]
MTTDQILAVAILFGALVAFVDGRLRHDLIALGVLVATALAGLVPQDEIFDGFGHPAVLTVMAVLILSAALNRSGVVELAAAKLGPYTKNQFMHILVLCGAVAVLSAFINNVGALALMMPVALATASEHGRNPAILLMPLAFAAILGGMTTLIGTPPNIIIANFRAEPFGLFDFTPVGLAVAAAGVAFVATVGWRLLPFERRAQDPQSAIFEVGGYLTELRVPEGSPLVGQPMRQAQLLFEHGASVFGIQRTNPNAPDGGEGRRIAAVGYRVLQKGDILLVRASTETLAKLISTYKLEVARETEDRRLQLDREIDWKDASLLEAVLSPTSPLVGRNARSVDRIFGRNVTLLALARQGAPIVGRLREQTFQAGDVALLQGDAAALPAITERFALWPLANRGLNLSGGQRQPFLALAVFVASLLLGLSGLVSIGVAFLLAVLVYVLMGTLPLRDLYTDVDWPVIVLLGAMFPLGMALESTGVTGLIATGLTDGAA